MELWMDLLFGNWIGILSILAVLGTLATGAFVLTMVFTKSRKHD